MEGATGIEVALQVAKSGWIPWVFGRIGGLTDMHVKVGFDEGMTERKRMT